MLGHHAQQRLSRVGKQQGISGCGLGHRRLRCSRANRKSGRLNSVTVRAGPVEIDENDLIQGKDRHKWYEARFCADDQPAWNIGRFVANKQISPDYRAVTLECEASRERVPLRSAYKAAGQRAMLRINNGVERSCSVASAPFPESINCEPLFKVRGDLFAHEIKAVREPISIMAELTVVVDRKEAPEVYGMGPDDVVEVGPFSGTGLDLRNSPLMAIFACPTVVIFVEGKGIATCAALLESTSDVPNLSLEYRKDIRVYYKAPNSASLAFKERFEDWERRGPIRILTTTTTFQDAFDDDDTLTYDPETTGAIILVEGDEVAEKAAREVCKDAEITRILADSVEQPPVVHLSSNPFEDWMSGKIGARMPPSRRGKPKQQQPSEEGQTPQAAPQAAPSAATPQNA